MKYSVIVPCFNEEDNIVTTITRIAEHLETLDGTWEILVVNDGSTDNTRSVAEEYAARNQRVRVLGYEVNTGRGKALRTGFAGARGDFVCSTDADLSYDPLYIPQLFNALTGDPAADMMLASPYMEGGGTEGVPWKRLLISKLGNRIISFAMGGKIKTITCVFRAYRREVLDSLDLEADGKEIHLEILSKALAIGFKAKEFPAVLKSRVKGKSKFKFKGTAISHLLFTLYEKPMMLFGVSGGLLLAFGTLGGVYLTYMRFAGILNPNRPLMTLVVILVLAGIQVLSFGFIANQIGVLKKELYRVQKENLNLLQRFKRD